MIVRKTGFLLGYLTALGCLAATPVHADPAAAPGVAPYAGIGPRVASALAEAQGAHDSGDSAAMADALGVIERSGAHPLPGWTGPDPVREWRAAVPAASSPLRGSPLGPGYRLGQVSPGQSESFEQVFLSGRKASVSLATRGGSPISLRVTDGERHVVCQSGQTGANCNWVPLFTQRYRIEVHNGGRNSADYYLVVD